MRLKQIPADFRDSWKQICEHELTEAMRARDVPTIVRKARIAALADIGLKWDDAPGDDPLPVVTVHYPDSLR